MWSAGLVLDESVVRLMGSITVPLQSRDHVIGGLWGDFLGVHQVNCLRPREVLGS